MSSQERSYSQAVTCFAGRIVDGQIRSHRIVEIDGSNCPLNS